MAQLPEIARYFPFASGRYEVKPGFHALRTDFGNGPADQLLWQLDRDYGRYREAKLQARAERLAKYYVTGELPEEQAHAVCACLARSLARQQPAWFTLREAGGDLELHCALSGDRLRFDGGGRLLAVSYGQAVQPAYVDGLDALACQLQEDLALFRATPADNRLLALHLCYPNHWAAEDKIGKDFIAVHAPVPGMDNINRNAGHLLHTALRSGPLVRFAWGLATDDRLNHHPQPPPGEDPAAWRGRSLDDEQTPVFVRSERQTLSGLPVDGLGLFTIHTYFLPLTDLRDDAPRLRALVAALASIPEESLHYKGLAPYRERLLRRLRSWLEDDVSGV